MPCRAFAEVEVPRRRRDSFSGEKGGVPPPPAPAGHAYGIRQSRTTNQPQAGR